MDVTLHIGGNDIAPTWTILNVSLLRARSPWLRIPNITGETSVGDATVQIRLLLSASRLRERGGEGDGGAYVEKVPIDVRSDFTSVARTQLLDISLTVQAAVSFAVWADPDDSGAGDNSTVAFGRSSSTPLLCSSRNSSKRPTLSDTTVDLDRIIYFTSCGET